jgi:hypothetical protein
MIVIVLYSEEVPMLRRSYCRVGQESVWKILLPKGVV